MSNTLWIVSGILGLVAVSAFFIIAYGIEVQPVQITVVAGILVIALAGFLVSRTFDVSRITGMFRTEEDEARMMRRAILTAREHHKEVTDGEVLSMDFASCTGREFNDKKAYGVLMYRHSRWSDLPGTPVTMVVVRNGRSMIVDDWQAHPTPELQDNPFLIWAAGYTGVPVKGMTPGQDASFYRGSAPVKPGPLVTIGGDVDRFLHGGKEEG